MSSNMKSILFAVIMALICGLLLTTAATSLQDMQERNVANDRRKNILLSVDLISRDETYTPEEIAQSYGENIEQYAVNGTGMIIDPGKVENENFLPIYLYTEKDKVHAYIIPFESPGLWGKIYGYLALENDGSTVAGFTIYAHSETPGLGGEIDTRWFQEKFEGKQIVDRQGDFVSVKIAKGEVEKQVPEEKEKHYVDGISGATLTGQYLTQGIQRTLSEYEPVSVDFRKNRLRCRMPQDEPWCEEDVSDQK